MGIIFLVIGAYIISRAIYKVVGQYTHLTKEEVRDLMHDRIDRNSSDYSRIIRHLGLCSPCQELLHHYKEGDDIEDHLVE